MPSEFTEHQIKWLAETLGTQPVESLVGTLDAGQYGELEEVSAADQREKYVAIETKKQERLDCVRERLEQQKTQLRQLMEFRVTLESGESVSAYDSGESSDPQKEFDAVRHMKTTTRDSLPAEELVLIEQGRQAIADLRYILEGKIPKKDFEEIYEQHFTDGKSIAEIATERLVAEETVQMAIEAWSARDTGSVPEFVADNQPLFNDRELQREFFEPLVRERILTDNEVLDQFNATEQLFAGASSAYEERLEEYSLELPDNHEQIEAWKKRGVLLKSVAKIGGDAAGAFSAFTKASEMNDYAEIAKEGADLLKAVEAASLLATSSMEAFYSKQCEGVVDALGNAIESWFKVAGMESLGKSLKASVTAAAKASEIGEALLGEERDIAAAIGSLADCLGAAFEVGGDEDMKRIGKGAKHLLARSLDAKAIYDCLKRDPKAVGTVISLVGKGVSDVLNDVLGDPSIAEQSASVSEAATDVQEKRASINEAYYGQDKRRAIEKWKEARGEQQDAEDEYEEAIGEIFESIATGLEEAGGEIQEARDARTAWLENLRAPEKREELAKKIEEKANQALISDITDAIENSTFPEGIDWEADRFDIEKECVAIQPLIADVKRLNAYSKIKDALLDSAKAGGEFIPFLKVATSGCELLKNILIMLRKQRQLSEWIHLRQDALASASAAGSAVASAVHNLELHYDEADYKASLSLLETLGAGLKLTGAGAVVGEVIEKSASAGGAMLEIILANQTASDLDKAWKAYRLALDNPGDRIQMREAIEKNSTLAKYAMAYAALEFRDPIAIEGMNYAGLSEETLHDPGTNVSNVVEYLEAVWENDPQHLRRVPVPAKWLADKSGDLTLKCWMSNKAAAMADTMGAAKLPSSSDTGAIDGAMLAVERSMATLQEKQEEWAIAERSFEPVWSVAEQAAIAFTEADTLCSDVSSQLKSLKKTIKQANESLEEEKKSSDWSENSHKVSVLKKLLKELVELDPLKRFHDMMGRVDMFSIAAERANTSFEIYLQKSETHLALAAEIPAIRSSYDEALVSLHQALSKFRPLTEAGTLNQSVIEYIQMLLAQTDEARKNLSVAGKNLDSVIADVQDLRIRSSSILQSASGKKVEYEKNRAAAKRFSDEYKPYFDDCMRMLAEASGG